MAATGNQADVSAVEGTFQYVDAHGSLPATARFCAFGTLVTFASYEGGALCHAAFAKAYALCQRWECLFSRHEPNSDISRISAAAPEAVEIAPETADLLDVSLRYCAESEGVFDITVGPLVRLWDFSRGLIPEQIQIDTALQHVDWHALSLTTTPEGRRLARLSDARASLDVGGTAKGWIADRLALQLRSEGLGAFLINLGGNVMACGQKPDGSPWNVGVRNPQATDRILCSVGVRNAAVVTSGVYERCFERRGRTYHHILDPRTGWPMQTDLAGATLVCETALDAEGYSTTVLALGIDRARQFVKQHPAIRAAILVDRKNRVHSISAAR